MLVRKKLFDLRSFVQNLIILFCEHLPFFVFTICCAASPCKRLEFKPIRNLQYKTDQQWPTCLLSTCWVVVLFDWSEVSQQNQLTNMEPPKFKYISSQGNASLPKHSQLWNLNCKRRRMLPTRWTRWPAALQQIKTYVMQQPFEKYSSSYYSSYWWLQTEHILSPIREKNIFQMVAASH